MPQLRLQKPVRRSRAPLRVFQGCRRWCWTKVVQVASLSSIEANIYRAELTGSKVGGRQHLVVIWLLKLQVKMGTFPAEQIKENFPKKTNILHNPTSLAAGFGLGAILALLTE